MDCKWCGGPVDDPFWDDTCPECEHEMYHSREAFYPSCSMCLADADDDYQQGYGQDEGVFIHVGL